MSTGDLTQDVLPLPEVWGLASRPEHKQRLSFDHSPSKGREMSSQRKSRDIRGREDPRRQQVTMSEKGQTYSR